MCYSGLNIDHACIFMWTYSLLCMYVQLPSYTQRNLSKPDTTDEFICRDVRGSILLVITWLIPIKGILLNTSSRISVATKTAN